MKQAWKKNRPTIDKEGKEKVDIFNKYNDLIESIKGLLFNGLKYEEKDGLFYYGAYFSVGDNITHEYIEDKVNQASEKIDSLIKVQQEVENENILNGVQKDLIRKRIVSAINSLEYHKNVIYIEAEKAGFKLTDEERDYYNKKKLKIEQELYGDPITKLDFRKKKVLEKLKDLYSNFPNDNLTEEQKIFWQTKIAPLLPDDMDAQNEKITEKKIPDIYISEESIFPIIESLLQIEGFGKNDSIRIETSKDEAQNEVIKKDKTFCIPKKWKTKEIYDYFKSIGLGEKFKIIKKNLGNNSVDIRKENDTFKKNEISLSPAENGKYNLTNKVLPIIFDHETSTHINTGIGDFYNLYLRDPERGDLEEAIALINQKFSQSLGLEKVYETSVGDVGQLLGEMFDDDDLEKAVILYYELSGNKDNAQDRVRRIRIGVPKGFKGSRRSDLSYGNSKEIVRELEELTKTPEGIKILKRYARLIYSTKLGYESMEEIDGILEGITTLKKLKPNFPIFAGKIIYWKLFKGTLNKDEMLKDDLRRLIRTNKKASYAQKKLLLKILQIIQQDSEYKRSINKSE